MKTKPTDKLYCGVDKDKIDSANPVIDTEILKYHHLYLTERHEIYKRKEILKLPKDEWTDDDVFKYYRFTNVRRELDTHTIWLIDHIANNPDLSMKDKILNILLFRSFNKIETAEYLNIPIKGLDKLTEDDMVYYGDLFNKKMKIDPKHTFFTGAFLTGGLKKGNAFLTKPYARTNFVKVITKDGDKLPMKFIEARAYILEHEGSIIEDLETNVPLRIIRMVQRFAQEGSTENIINAQDQSDVYNEFRKINGFREFLSYQIFIDLCYIEDFQFSENEFTVAGPGCNRGVSALFKDKDGMTDEECIFWYRDNIERIWEENNLKYYPEELFDHLPKEERYYNLMMIENSFCELQKIVKSKTNSGRPRKKYITTETTELGEW